MTCPAPHEHSPRAVTLLDGSQVCSCSQEHRHECEARDIYALDFVHERRARLEDIEKKRGHEARLALERTIWEIHKRRRQK